MSHSLQSSATSWDGPALVRSLPLAGRIGAGFVALATFGLAIAQLLLDGTQRPESGFIGPLIDVLLLIVAASSLILLFYPGKRLGWLGPGLFWSVLVLFGVTQAVREIGLTALVEPWQALVVTLAIATVARGDRSHGLRGPALAMAAGMLLLFGTIHIVHAVAVAGLVPAWVPFRSAIPYLTGLAQLAAGLVFALPGVRPFAATGIALMFLGWLPLVHAGRLLAEPGSLSEWRFALTALALAGSLLVLATPAGQAEARPE